MVLVWYTRCGTTLRMFRLNIYAGLPEVAHCYENLFRISDPMWKGCPPGISRSMRMVVPQKNTPLGSVFLWYHWVIMIRLTTVFFLISVSVLVTIHALATYLDLYWFWWWLDIPMHILGGSSIVLGIATARDIRIPHAARLLTLPNAILTVLLGAISWEVYQFLTTPSVKDGYVLDTLGDVGFGLIGGLLGWYIVRALDQITS